MVFINSCLDCFLNAQFPIRSLPSVLLLASLKFFPQREPAPCAGYTSASSGKSWNLVVMVSYIISASSSRFAFIFPAFSRRSGLPTSPINKVSPVKRIVSLPSVATIVILSGEWPGVLMALSVTFPNWILSPSSKD